LIKLKLLFVLPGDKRSESMIGFECKATEVGRPEYTYVSMKTSQNTVFLLVDLCCQSHFFQHDV